MCRRVCKLLQLRLPAGRHLLLSPSYPPQTCVPPPLQPAQCFPKEEEYLYPPMTYLQPDRVHEDEDSNLTVVDVTPQMS